MAEEVPLWNAGLVLLHKCHWIKQKLVTQEHYCLHRGLDRSLGPMLINVQWGCLPFFFALDTKLSWAALSHASDQPCPMSLMCSFWISSWWWWCTGLAFIPLKTLVFGPSPKNPLGCLCFAIARNIASLSLSNISISNSVYLLYHRIIAWKAQSYSFQNSAWKYSRDDMHLL